MKSDLVTKRNPDLKFISDDVLTPQQFTDYVATSQESL
jgi:hypothetical protein